MNIDAEHSPTDALLRFISLLPFSIVFLAVMTGYYFEQHGRFAEAASEREFPLDFNALPAVAPGESLLSDTVAIDIHPDGTVSIAGVLSEAPANSELLLLRNYLVMRRPSLNHRTGGVWVRPNEQATFQRLIDVLGAVTGSGIYFYGVI